MTLLLTQSNDPLYDFSSLETPIHVVGIGANGSDIVRTLAKGGLRAPLHLWDGDTVEAKNLRNQTYMKRHVGLPKVAALAEQRTRWGDGTAFQHFRYAGAGEKFSGIVFLCVDSMATRRNIYQNCIKGKQEIPLCIETRMDGVSVVVHAFDPCNPIHQQRWESYWYRDEEAVNETAGCAGPTLVLQCASMAADLATLQLMHYVAERAGTGEGPWNQVRLNLRRMELKAYRW